jgi:hypothetical protein
MAQMARNATDDASRYSRQLRYVFHGRDDKFCSTFDQILRSSGVLYLISAAKSQF